MHPSACSRLQTFFCPSHGVVYFGVIRLRPNNAGEGLGRSDCLPVGLASGKEEASVQLAHKLHALPTSTREGDYYFFGVEAPC
jgi:hypothetical protein